MGFLQGFARIDGASARVGEVNERVGEQGTSSQARASCHIMYIIMAETHQAISNVNVMYHVTKAIIIIMASSCHLDQSPQELHHIIKI
jgi:hypothetical protein